MSRRLIVRPEAEDDITAAALWYEDRDAGRHAALRGPHLGIKSPA